MFTEGMKKLNKVPTVGLYNQTGGRVRVQQDKYNLPITV